MNYRITAYAAILIATILSLGCNDDSKVTYGDNPELIVLENANKSRVSQVDNVVLLESTDSDIETKDVDDVVIVDHFQYIPHIPKYNPRHEIVDGKNLYYDKHGKLITISEYEKRLLHYRNDLIAYEKRKELAKSMCLSGECFGESKPNNQ